MNHNYRPMLAELITKPFSDEDWIFEVKWDGFRAIAYVNQEISVKSRNDKELRYSFPELQELKKLTNNVVLDGEIVIIKDGKPNFQALLARRPEESLGIKGPAEIRPATYVVFDILEKNGTSTLNLPLIERKKLLRSSVKDGKYVMVLDFVEEKGEEYYNAVLKNGLEGVIAKKKDSKYQPGIRSMNWLKVRKLKSCDCVIFGYTKGTGLRANTFGALILGLYNQEKKSVFVGKVGTGFSQETLQVLCTDFQKLITEETPFEVDIGEEITWLKPTLVCEVIYQDITKDIRLRMPRFHALREDKNPSECTIDQLVNVQLAEYTAKRDFSITSEPRPETKETERRIFIVQEHHARNLHYDFRLENAGVLVSWAVPKGIPELTNEKRLAVQTEDHPIDYAKFEGTIPEGQYGAGKVIIWDKGTFDVKTWEDNKIEFILHGERLKGRYVLVRLKRADKKNWLLLKGKEYT